LFNDLIINFLTGCKYKINLTHKRQNAFFYFFFALRSFVPSMEVKNKLISWYNQNKRQLPWRNSSDPYIVWVSEIILQQTRVGQGLEYFNRFVSRFPDIFSLASASEQEVLKYWQGLGYYSRARNMQITARAIVSEFNGVFPESSHELVKLKGIGPYTASAIASICFGEACPVVDGNVMRVIARYFGISLPVNSPQGQKAVFEAALQILDRGHAGTFNQAIMEFGALQCTPRRPDCLSCPLLSKCSAFHTKTVDLLPVKIKPGKPRVRHFNYLAIRHMNKQNNAEIYLHKRTGKDIWEGLYELPLIESLSAMEPDELFGSAGWTSVFGKLPLRILDYSEEYKHQLSHQTIYARFVSVQMDEPPAGNQAWQKVEIRHLHDYPIPRLIDKYFRKNKVF
jgi:A/G-specific adenine glycosylase